MFDIDNFKLYNDTYGHIEGDNVLKQVAKVIQNQAKRGSDFVFRLGGEEFGIYARIDKIDNLDSFLEQFLEEIRKLELEHIHNPPYNKVTISMGAVIAKISKNSTVSFEEIYKIVDDLMYEAKRNGKNQKKIKVIEV
jgi:diguanylate cyclase (GGDEF)-like protein